MSFSLGSIFTVQLPASVGSIISGSGHCSLMNNSINEYLAKNKIVCFKYCIQNVSDNNLGKSVSKALLHLF